MMKQVFIFFACIGGLFFTINVNAQSTEPILSKPTENKLNAPLVTKSKRPICVAEFGQTFNAFDLSHLPYRNVNSIANMVAGVNSYGGGIPNIKGAPASGTAYFVDGVRVHGAIPSLR